MELYNEQLFVDVEKEMWTWVRQFSSTREILLEGLKAQGFLPTALPAIREIHSSLMKGI